MFELACNDLAALVEKEEFIAILAITLGCTVGVVALITGTIVSIVKTRATENTRRELAAYVAEGTLKPEDALAMLNAGRPKSAADDLGEYA